MNGYLEERVNKIKGRSYHGSSTRDAHLYHDLPFRGLDQFNYHRGNTRERIRRIARACRRHGKTILDLGCSVGGISLGMAQLGAKSVLGIDYDNQSIDVAKSAAEKLGYNNVKFECREITMSYIMNMDRFDVILWLSNWMWIVKQHGIEFAKEMLFQVSKKCETLVFESAANDGKARIVGATQDDIYNWLQECVIHQRIRREPAVKGWMNRDLFVCNEPLICIDASKRARTACIIRSEKDLVKKIYDPKYSWMQEREVEALKRLAPSGRAPLVIGEGDGYIEMTYVGSHRGVGFANYQDQGLKILKELKDAGITHRDIKHANLMRLKDKIHIIDFGWCLFNGEDPKKILSDPSLPYERGITDEDRIKGIFRIK